MAGISRVLGPIAGIALLSLAAPAVAQSAPSAGAERAATGIIAADRAAIIAAMQRSADGWNAGDLDRFLGVYADDPATAFVTARGVVRGVAAIKARYRQSYSRQFGTDASTRDRLGFTFEDWRTVGRDHVLLIARYSLTPAAGGKEVSGYTTLLFGRTAAGWRIVADHSS